MFTIHSSFYELRKIIVGIATKNRKLNMDAAAQYSTGYRLQAQLIM